MGEGAAVGQGNQLGELVRASRTTKESSMSALRADEGGGGLDTGGGGRGAAEGSAEGHGFFPRPGEKLGSERTSAK